MVIVTRMKSQIKAQDGVMISRGRGEDNSTEILSTKPKHPKKQVGLWPIELVLPIKKQRIEPIEIRKHLVSDANELDVTSRRNGRKHWGDVPLHKPNVHIACVSFPLRLRFKGKRRRTRLKPWPPGPLLVLRAIHQLPHLTTKVVQRMLRLRIPMLPSDSDWSQVEYVTAQIQSCSVFTTPRCLQYLNWEIDPRFPPDILKPSDLHRANVGPPRLTEVEQIEANHQKCRAGNTT
jgi:hypothetical protein